MIRLLPILLLAVAVLPIDPILLAITSPAAGLFRADPGPRSARPAKSAKPDDPGRMLLLQRGDQLLGQHEYEAALLIFQGIIEDDPDYWMAYQRAARALHALGRTDEAIQAAEKANALHETAMTHADLAWLCLQKGARDEAVAHGRRAVELDPTTEHTHAVLGDAFFATGDFNRALAAYRRANSVRETGYAWAGIGLTQFQLKQYEQAVASLETAVRLDPGARSELFEVRARIAHLDGRLDQAIEEMSKAIDATSNKSRQSMLQGELGDYCLEQGDYQKAADLFGPKVRIGVQISQEAKGFHVQKVSPNSPADLAGIRLDDILIQFEDQPLAGVDLNTFIQGMLGKAAFGSIVRLKVDRQGQALSLPVVAGIVPDLPRRAREALAAAQPEPPGTAGGAPGATGMVQGPPAATPSFRILSAVVNPSPVPARGDFQVDLQLIVTSPSAPSEIPVTLSCEISWQDQVIYTPPASDFQAPNGQALDIHKKLTAGSQPGTYRIRIRLSGAGLAAETAVDFDIR